MINAELKLAGQYKLVKTSADGSVEETPWSNNLILDAGLARLGADGQVVFSSLQVGSGTLAVAAAQTRLNSWVGGTSIAYESTTPLGELSLIHISEPTRPY